MQRSVGTNIAMNNWIHKTKSGEWNIKESRITLNFWSNVKIWTAFPLNLRVSYLSQSI